MFVEQLVGLITAILLVLAAILGLAKAYIELMKARRLDAEAEGTEDGKRPRGRRKAYWIWLSVSLVLFGSGGWLGRTSISLPVRMVHCWDFEKGTTTEKWGVLPEGGTHARQSPDVVTSADVARGGEVSLKVKTIDLRVKEKPGSHKKWLAVRYSGADLARARKLVASLYVPSNAEFDYADAKFFLKDSAKEWHESGAAGEGVELCPGDWVELSWDLDQANARDWLRPWLNILGIQLYVDGKFDGPVYLDEVRVYE